MKMCCNNESNENEKTLSRKQMKYNGINIISVSAMSMANRQWQYNESKIKIAEMASVASIQWLSAVM